jgi:DNA-binding CsgD family transcriptional regulator/tetratricopeptide (TPR) repeat protein
MGANAAGLSSRVVGREHELAAVERLLADARTRFSVLLLEGDAGIGKTVVFDEALRIAEASNFHVFWCRPAASEARLSLTSVGDLLDGVSERAWEGLPAPQRRALDVALLHTEPGERGVDQRAIAAGFRSVVSGLAGERPVLLAVDDVQWLDAASATILSFVLRRLRSERVGFLATHRLSEAARLDVAALAPPDALARQRLGPLSLGALRWTLRERLGAALPRAILVRVHAVSGGNPLFALEIGRLLAERGTTTTAEPLPVPDDVRALVRSRVAALPAGTRDVLLAAALLARPAVGTLGTALGGSVDASLEPAERAAIAARNGEVVAFAHPLHAAAVVGIATTAERRRMHGRLAEAVRELEERASHLALAADGPDEATATFVEQAAVSARARGGLHSAAELLEWACALTPAADLDASRRRRIRAAEVHIRGGDRDRARTLLHELLEEALVPAERAEALRLLAELAFGEEDLGECERLLRLAVATDDDPRRSVRALLDLTFVSSTHRMDWTAAAEFGNRALATLRESDDGPLLAEALAYSAMGDFLAGRGADWGKVERALLLEDPDRIAPMGMPPRAVCGCIYLFVDRYPEARDLLNTVRKRLAERGDEGDLAFVLLWLSWLEMRCGDFDAAGRIADEAIAFAAAAGNLSMQRWAIGQRAFIHAHRGELREVQRRTAEAELLDERGVAQVALYLAATQTLVELSVGDVEAAWDVCRPLVEALEQFGIGEVSGLFFVPDALEALVGLGHLARADALLDQFERRGRELDRAWALATGARCRGLLLAARGDLPGALAALECALVEHERLDMPYERARTLLAKGVTARRARRRAVAKEALEQAASEFERMSARVWTGRARAELDRLGGRRRGADGELTPSEQRVVELAVEGLSNKEIAARLVVTVHTVEVHLSHAYAKLGVRSRAQLARRILSP